MFRDDGTQSHTAEALERMEEGRRKGEKARHRISSTTAEGVELEKGEAVVFMVKEILLRQPTFDTIHTKLIIKREV